MKFFIRPLGEDYETFLFGPHLGKSDTLLTFLLSCEENIFYNVRTVQQELLGALLCQGL